MYNKKLARIKKAAAVLIAGTMLSSVMAVSAAENPAVPDISAEGGDAVEKQDAAAELAEGQINDKVELSLELESDVVKQGSYIPVTLTVKNNSDETLQELDVSAVVVYRGENWDAKGNAWYSVSSFDLKAGESKTVRGGIYESAYRVIQEGMTYAAVQAVVGTREAGNIEAIQKTEQEVQYIPADQYAVEVDAYMNDIYPTDWFFKGFENHFYQETAPADDVAAVTVFRNEDYLYGGKYNNPETGRIEIPYDVFAADAANWFTDVPDLKSVKMMDLVWYEESIDAMCRPIGGGGNPSHIIEPMKTLDLGDGRYAVQFRISNQDVETVWTENIDTTDDSNYTKCTMTLEDNGKGGWKHVSLEAGYTNGTPKPEEPEKPVDPEQPSEPEKELPAEKVDQIVNEINNAEPGKEVSVDMGTVTVVPEEVLKAAKGKDVDVVLEMDGYAWIINGKSITADTLKDIDLEVKTDGTAVPEEIVDRLADGKPAKQITLVHNGAFGFTAELRIYAGTEYAQQYGNLFWYNNGKVEYMDSGLVGKDGCVELTFDHASDYVIVMSSRQMTEKDIPSDLKADAGRSSVPKTGDTGRIMLYLALMAGAAAAVAAARRKRA